MAARVLLDGVDFLAAAERVEDGRRSIGIRIKLNALVFQERIQLPLQPGHGARLAAISGQELKDDRRCHQTGGDKPQEK